MSSSKRTAFGTGSKSTGSSTAASSKKIPTVSQYFANPNVRETFESVLVAIILALLFKAFEAEAFIIPTGSMAPTLQGSHKDLNCPKCNYLFRGSASSENADNTRGRTTITAVECPMCRYEVPIDPKDSNHETMAGDRILVNKFAYDLNEPQRWSVIVFRNPENPKQNYIKRLVGKPNEFLRLERGDVFLADRTKLSDPDEVPTQLSNWEIARKPHHKLKAMLQLVHDSGYVATELQKAGWPSRWQQWQNSEEQRSWSHAYQGTAAEYSLKPSSELAMLRYRHLVPTSRDWTLIEEGKVPERITKSRGELITDYYEYNRSRPEAGSSAEYWVGDLAVDATVQVESDAGELRFELTEGGVHFWCDIDVATGTATLSASDVNQVRFEANATESAKLTAKTSVKGKGTYQVRFANVDDQLYLWVNDRPVEFSGPTTYQRMTLPIPTWNASDPFDAEPLGIGGRNLQVKVNRVRVLRDVYYTPRHDVGIDWNTLKLPPESWSSKAFVSMFAGLSGGVKIPDGSGQDRFVFSNMFALDENQFFPMGDNSPHSLDARYWPNGNFVSRDHLIGEATFLYWPHYWSNPIPHPNFRRMGFIH